jgi:hypothetical protein
MKSVLKLPVEVEDAEATHTLESSALEAMLQMYKEQQETNRLALNILRELGDKLTTHMHKEVMARRKNDAKQIEIERENLELQKQHMQVQNTRKCQSAKDLTELPKAALAAKSSATAKPKAKSGSRARKKTT